jgi:hypothetical protein
MRRNISLIMLLLLVMPLCMGNSGCNDSESRDRVTVDTQQKIYQQVQPVHIYDFSIPRDIYQQIYDMTTTQAVATYTVIETMTGVTKYQGPSIGFPIPADVQLTNGLQPAYNSGGAAIEQAEPNGLFSSKNTDATWTLFVDLKSGNVYPMYSEHKVSCWPFIVEKDSNGEWHRADNKPIGFKLEIKKGSGAVRVAPPTAQ